LRNAVFLDRDGVINGKLPEDRYVREVSEFEFLPGVFEALTTLKELGFMLVLVTNQRGIARELMSVDDLERVHGFMQSELKRRSMPLDAIYHCPHEKFEGCACRKPEPGMLLAACRDHGIDPSTSFMVGDSVKDVIAGKRAGVRTVRIADEDDSGADMVFPSLLAFALFMKGGHGDR
jgi:D,D-heptose 1,7-bisphosphate phosphatase